ncbi:hypothetical protein BDR06DRAFT_1003348 [Suillus hirtellus]|nr:hypothetical protein BDR06DRAFT_1003348 [Suillus hirtellus]
MAGQNFESAALQYFSRSGSNNAHIPDENDPDGDNELELEEGEIDEIDDTYQEGLDPVPLVDKIVEELIDDDTIMTGPMDHLITHGSTSAIFSSFLCLCPPITLISTHPSDQNMFSLNSPEPLLDDNDVQSDSHHLFFSGLKKSASSRDATPQDSEDSDISASHAMQGLRVNSRHMSPSIQGCSAVQVMKLSGMSTHSGSPQSSCPPSHKRTNDNQTSIATEHLSETVDALIQLISEKCDSRAEHDCYKDLKVRNAKDEREHAMHLAKQDFMHKRDLMGQQLEQTKLELELACAHREEEEM